MPLTGSRRRAIPVLLAVLLAAITGTVPARAALPVAVDGQPLPSLAPMLDRVVPGVVNIATYTTVEVRNPLLEDPFFRRFFNVPNQPQVRRTQSAGSGVIVDAGNGYVVTNNHVVERADEITVTLADGRALPATLVGRDAAVDLAVLKVQGEGLAAIDFADSSVVRVGDFVVAIGNPFGLGQTVTSGIVSALGRSGLGIEGYEDFIQTDASINPGNSGGALVDLSGRLIGINTAIFSRSGGNIGIGFAIPSGMVQAVLAELIAHGEVRRGNVGLRVQALNPELAAAFGVKGRDGVVVVAVDADSAAAKAGLAPGDVVVEFAGRKIRRPADYHNGASVVMLGQQVPITVLRGGVRQAMTLQISDSEWQKLEGERIDPKLAGALLQNFRAEGSPEIGAGVRIVEVAMDSPMWRYGLRAGDIIVAVNQRAVQNLSDFTQGAGLSARRMLLRVYREGQFYSVMLQ